MSPTIAGSDVELGRWYPADLPPPRIPENLDSKYSFLLGIQSVGIRSGFYDYEESQYYWHCERFDSFGYENIPGWTFNQQVNANLDWVYEVARGVSVWMLIPDFDNELPSYDGTSGFSLDPELDWSVREEEEGEEDTDLDLGESVGPRGAEEILPIHPN